ncbi:hypothetical protein Hanom_Chr04g00363281 [Helianthus anomalus]
MGPEEVLALQDDPNRPLPQCQSYQPGASSQEGGFPNVQSLTDLLKENLLCTRNTYNMASNANTRIRAVGRSIAIMQEDVTYIREHMTYRDEEDNEDEDMD